MLYHLLYPLKEYFGPFNLFHYITFRAAYAAVISLLLCLFLGPWFIKKMRKKSLGERIREEVPDRHRRKKGTPTMGGMLILFSVVVPILLLGDFTNRYMHLSLLTLVWLGLLGFWDDYRKIRGRKGLSKRTKLLWQIGLGLIVGSVLYFLPVDPYYKSKTNLLLFKNFLLDFGMFYMPFSILVITASTNAVNFADGLDGLAVGLLGIALGAYAVFSYVAGHIKIAGYLNVIYAPGAGELTVVCAAALGAILGFLWFNSYPASIFMGDTGSLSLGGLVGVVALIAKQEILLIIVGGVFVLEAISVIIQVIGYHGANHKRIFKMAPLHHHFELSGWSEPKIVVRFWILAMLFVFLALSTLKIR